MAGAPDLTDDDKAALVKLLRQTIAVDPFPVSPRVKRLRAILHKIDPQPARPQPFPAPEPAGERSLFAEAEERAGDARSWASGRELASAATVLAKYG